MLFIAALHLLTGCANMVSPTGGPKDVTPPKIIACQPPVSSTWFKGNTFRIDFNEFINLKNPATEVYISPPLKTPLDPHLRGKSMIVKFENKLDTNTTYSITFGNSITDLTEGNILKGFNYVFSTGSYVDTLSLQGTLVNAFDHKPEKDVYVELYINNNDTLPFDSLPIKVAPYYITKTDENGGYLFKNLQNKKFKLFALSDQNGDLIYNQPSEKMAFYDSLVSPWYRAVPRIDTARKDTTLVKKTKPARLSARQTADLRIADSIHKADSIKQDLARYPSYPLFLFEESDSIQRLLKSTFVKEGMALFKYRFPLHDIRFVPLNFDSVAPWCLEEFSRQRDSVTLWITRPKTDSLVLKVVTSQKAADTVTLVLQKKELTKRAAKKAIAEQLSVNVPAKSAGLNHFKNKLLLTFSYPITRWNFSKVLLVENKDTVHPALEFTDSLRRTIMVKHKWKEDETYKIIIPDSLFFGITNLSHDSILISFKTRAEREFGNLIVAMNMDNRPGQYIVQLMNEKETAVYEEQVVTKSGKIRFDFMPPGKYKVKAIHDRNRNGHWDTGSYKKNMQPEEVIYLPKIIEIRANWDVEEEWN
ncbi:MAG: Ig-like domain-containing protein [Bacteroidota bacterium]